MAALHFHLFGYPHLLLDDRQIEVERRKTLALAAYLAVETGAGSQNDADAAASCSRETLAALFWPEAAPQQAGAYLRQAFWDLSRAAGAPLVEHDGPTARFSTQQRLWVDVNAFVLALETWKADPGRCCDAAAHPLAAAVDLYAGDFLAGFSLRDSPGFDGWQASISELLRMQLSQALETLFQHHLSRAEYEPALGYARRWLALDALEEAAQRAVMQVYLQSGQRSAAQRQYQQCAALLAQELGVEPSPETRALARQIQGAPPAGEPALPPGIPTGTVTFVFTDIEGSTRLWETYPQAMPAAHQRQETIIREAMAARGGYVYKMIGDAFQVAFSTAGAALDAAVDAQRRLQAEPWGAVGQLKVRMALHTCGSVEERGDDYVGPELNRVARIMSAGFGGQVLLSQVTASLLAARLPEGVALRDLGAHQLKDLDQPERVFQVCAPALQADFPPLKSVEPASFTLPVLATPLLGREEELAQIETLLASPDCRLITLLGIGGTGKTRLSIQAASRSRVFQQRACFVPLAQAQSTDDMVLAIAQALAFPFQSSTAAGITGAAARQQLLRFLADKRLLLILDNFEQLTASADFVAELLQAAPQLKLIVTSRERLNLPGEWQIETVGLAFPGRQPAQEAAGYPAVQLFVTTAQRVSSVRVSAEDIPAVTRICQLLEGLPLGIEMAASWTKMLSCAEIAAEMERTLDFLSTSWRGMPERHRTLRAVFDHSWNLLSERERAGFVRLAVFHGSFNRQTALEVTGATVMLLAQLTDKSFLRRAGSAAPENGRYEIHPVLRGYAREKLAADSKLETEVNDLHARYFSRWLRAIAADLRGPRQVDALVALRAEIRNQHAALRWLVAQEQYDTLERMLPDLVLFGIMNDQRMFHQSLVDTFTSLAERLRERDDRPALLAMVYAILRYYAFVPGGEERIFLYGQRCLDLLARVPDAFLKASTILLRCTGPRNAPVEEVAQLANEALAIFTSLGDAWGVAMVHLILGDLYNYSSADFDRALDYYHASSQTFLQQENKWGLSLCYFGLMDLTERAGDLFESHQYGCLAEQLFRELGNQERVIHVNDRLAQHAIQLGQVAAARAYYRANQEICASRGYRDGQRHYEDLLAGLAPANQP